MTRGIEAGIGATVPAATVPAGAVPAGAVPAGTAPAGTAPAGTAPGAPPGTGPVTGRAPASGGEESAAAGVRRRRILVVDNYDSFVFNLVQYLGQLGADCEVRRNDDVDLASVRDYDGVLLSPGPGTPESAGVCVELLRSSDGLTPIFGVCLGLQAIGVAFGGRVSRAPELLHGKTSQVLHDGVGVLAGLPSPFTATRYHSLAIEPESVPDVLQVTARTASGVIMAAVHRHLPIEGVQFHPESVLTEGGHRMLAHWLVRCGDPQALARSVGLAPVVPSLS